MDILSQISELLPVLPPFQLQRVERDEDNESIHLYLEVAGEHIPDNHSLHSTYPRTWEHLKLFQYRCFIHCDLPIYRHKKSGKLKKAEVSFSRDYSRFTLMFEREVMRLMKIYHCFTTVAKNLQLYPQRVEQIYHYYTSQYSSDSIEQVPVRIAYDETSTRKGHQYLTTFFDLDTWKIIGIYEGKSSECVAQFYHDHPYPEAVKEISIDMSPAFIKGAKQYFPTASITFDKWHVIKLIYKHLDTLKRKAYQFKAYLELHNLKIEDIYKQDTHEKMSALIAFISHLAEEFMETNSISKTLKKHFDGIIQYAKSKINNGVLEGINSKIQIIKRVARGFRYKQNFIKMIRFIFDNNPLQVIS